MLQEKNGVMGNLGNLVKCMKTLCLLLIIFAFSLTFKNASGVITSLLKASPK